MPSHITHGLSARLAAERAGLFVNHPSWFLLGSQGPDLFLHNQRTRPGALLWGRSLHHRGFGDFVCAMEKHISSWDSREGNYVLGFMTHGILDRITHPYIHAGSAGRVRNLHAFFERLIDVEMSLRLEGRHPHDYSFLQEVTLGESAPESLVHLLARGAEQRFPSDRKEQRIQHAYQDTMGLLKFSDRWDDEVLNYIKRSSAPGKLISLLHPPQVPGDIHVFNEQRNPWPHPWDGGRICRESFIDLFEQATDLCASVLHEAVRSNPASACQPERRGGNGNLNGSEPSHRPARTVRESARLEEFFEEYIGRILSLSSADDLIEYTVK